MNHAYPRVHRRLGRAVRAGLLAVTTGLSGLALLPQPASAAELVNEPFTGVSTPANVWTMSSPTGQHQPCLTAASTPPAGSLPACQVQPPQDPAGQGAFQLTDNSRNTTGALLLNQAVQAGQGLRIEFDMFQYKAAADRGEGADGMSFFFVDGAKQNVQPGEPGGALAYKGIDGAIVGVGFDQYGNFSTPSSGKEGPGKKPNSVVLRGGSATGWQYIKGVESTGPLAMDGATKRDQAKRHVVIDLSNQNYLTLSMDYNDGKGAQVLMKDVNLDALPGQPKLPATLKLGFAASTGNKGAYHEIQGFKAATLGPNLKTEVTNTPDTFKAGDTGTIIGTVSNAKDAGPTTGPTTLTIPIPEGTTLKSVEPGPGWTCDSTTDPKKVVCTRKDSIKPGETAPPVKVNVNVPADAKGPIPITATATTPDETKPEDNTPPTKRVPVSQGPDLKIDIKPEPNPFKPGEPNAVIGTVSNKADAGPTTGPTTMTIDVPDGTTVKSVEPGQGWTCDSTTDPKKVVCTRPDVIKPGETAPPVKVNLNVPADAKGPINIGGKTDTTGERNQGDNKTGPTPIEVTKGPDLKIDIKAEPNPIKAGDPAAVIGTVTNKADAGPTTGPTTMTIDVPDGTTVKSVEPGQGWTCDSTTNPKKVVCTRPDIIKPGETTPPVKVNLNVPADTKGPINIGGKTDTKGEKNPADNITGPTPVEVTPAGRICGPLEALIQKKIEIINAIIQGKLSLLGLPPKDTSQLDKCITDGMKTTGIIDGLIKAKLDILNALLGKKAGLTPTEQDLQGQIGAPAPVPASASGYRFVRIPSAE